VFKYLLSGKVMFAALAKFRLALPRNMGSSVKPRRVKEIEKGQRYIVYVPASDTSAEAADFSRFSTMET